MGGADSKLTEFLIEGKQDKALELYYTDETIKEQINPNARMSRSPYGDTPLLCTARHGMNQLLDILLQRGGNPHIANKKKETAFHLVCKFSQSIASSRKSRNRKEMLLTLLEYGRQNGLTSASVSHPQQCGMNGSLFNESLAARDEALNTPLHLACASGLLECVELLVANDAPLFVTNVAQQTPCDVAASAKHVVIAQLLESKMVFAESQGAHRLSRFSCTRPEKTLLDTDQMIELKQQLVESICRRLNISNFAAEALLMSYGWSGDLVVEAFEADQKQALDKAGISVTDMMSTAESPSQLCRSFTDAICEVCTEALTATNAVKLQCGHNFCEDCMKGYLEVRIQDGGGHNIQCPGEKCSRPIPSSVVGRLVSKELNTKYTRFDIRTFVDTNHTTKWCPHVECEGVVHLPPKIIANSNQEVDGAAVAGNTGINVECANGHLFCWSCHGSPHEPCDCDVWQRWVIECSNMNVSDAQTLKLTGQQGEAAANIQWILQNSKPCPKCNSPIQKNDGCNHISCSKCHYDFCWVCMDKWSLHNYKTGGYFMCNRFKQIEKADAKLEKQQESRARELRAQAKHQAQMYRQKFEEHYKRYSNHLQSAELERQLLKSSQEKIKYLAAMAAVAEKRVDKVLHRSNTIPTEKTRSRVTSEDFLADIIRTLIYSRHIMAISYVISYFIVDNTEAINHRHMQAILEEQVEEISQALNRPHLRTPKSKLIKMAKNLDSSLDAYKSRMNKTHRKLISLEESTKKSFSVMV